MNKYPDFYLRGNIELQETIDNFYSGIKVNCLKFLCYLVFLAAPMLFIGAMQEILFVFLGGLGCLGITIWYFLFVFQLIEDNEKQLSEPF